MITLEHAHILVGLIFLGFAILTLRDSAHPTRIRSALFWGLIAASMIVTAAPSTKLLTRASVAGAPSASAAVRLAPPNGSTKRYSVCGAASRR